MHTHDPQGQAPLHPQFPAPSAHIPALQTASSHIASRFAHLLHIESMSGIVLMLAAAIALCDMTRITPTPDVRHGSCSLYRSAPCVCRSRLPSPELTAVFSEANQAYFCDKEGSTKVAPLFGRVGLAYQLNFAALPRLPDDQGQTAPMPADVLAMRWVLHWGRVEAGDVDGLGLTTAQQSAIQSIRYDLAEHLAWLAENPKKSKYRLDPATPLASINTPDARDAALPQAVRSCLGR